MATYEEQKAKKQKPPYWTPAAHLLTKKEKLLILFSTCSSGFCERKDRAVKQCTHICLLKIRDTNFLLF